MAIIKCKMCGGDIVLSEDRSFGTCEYCGSTMTFPKVSDEQKLNLFNRANHFRRQNEFDKAIAAYDKILDQDDADAEAHWGAVLSRYGIEYVEDPVTHERIPTCHRVQPTSILTDQDYLAALEHAPDGESRGIYEQEAHRIADIQKGILAISSQEKPYDVFICYKESDDSGSRTVDSTLAQEIYYQLTNEGYKVFFSRITLEDKLGQQYEPYIFAALNSAKVMLVIGTKPEYFGAVWVKNEWSRFLALMKNDRSKLLIPCYRGMDPYDLPEELSTLQSQDMAKIGFIQDITRGIKKVLDDGKQKQAPAQPEAVVSAAPGVETLLTRAQLFLEDGDWESAREYADRILDIDPKFAAAYIVKVQAALKLRREEELAKSLSTYEDSADWKKAVRFAASAQRNVYEGYVASAVEAREENRKLRIYSSGFQMLQNATGIEDCVKAKTQFESIPGFRDADQQVKACLEKIERFKYQEADRKASQLAKTRTRPSEETAKQWEDLSGVYANIHWNNAEQRAQWCLEKAEAVRAEVYDMASRALEGASTPENCKSAMQLFESLGSFRDAKAQVEACQQKKAQLEAEIEAERKAEEARREREHQEVEAKAAKRRTRTVATLLLITIIAAGVTAYFMVIKPNGIYNSALKALNDGNFDEAKAIFESLRNYKDAATQAQESQYLKGKALIESDDYDAAMEILLSIPDYKDSTAQIRQIKYMKAIEEYTTGNELDALLAFAQLRGYGDSNLYIETIYSKYKQRIGITKATSDNTIFGVKSDGTVLVCGSFGYQEVKQWSNIVSIAPGSLHVVGLMEDGTVIAAGRNNDGQCDVGQTSGIKEIAAGDYHTVMLRMDGTVLAIGKNDNGQCNTSSWSDIVSVSARDNYTIGIKKDGSVLIAGSNDESLYLDSKPADFSVETWNEIDSVFPSTHYLAAIRKDGSSLITGGVKESSANKQATMLSWSDPALPQLVEDKAYLQFAYEYFSNIYGLCADGTVDIYHYFDGHFSCTENYRNDMGHLIAIDASNWEYFFVGLRTDGTVCISSDSDNYEEYREITNWDLW